MRHDPEQRKEYTENILLVALLYFTFTWKKQNKNKTHNKIQTTNYSWKSSDFIHGVPTKQTTQWEVKALQCFCCNQDSESCVVLERFCLNKLHFSVFSKGLHLKLA